MPSPQGAAVGPADGSASALRAEEHQPAFRELSVQTAREATAALLHRRPSCYKLHAHGKQARAAEAELLDDLSPAIALPSAWHTIPRPPFEKASDGCATHKPTLNHPPSTSHAHASVFPASNQLLNLGLCKAIAGNAPRYCQNLFTTPMCKREECSTAADSSGPSTRHSHASPACPSRLAASHRYGSAFWPLHDALRLAGLPSPTFGRAETAHQRSGWPRLLQLRKGWRGSRHPWHRPRP